MKPCSNNRKRIAWLALDALDAREGAALRKHLARCEGCRHYWEEILSVTEGLSAIPKSKLEASEFFHHRVAKKLQAAESSSGLENLAVWLRGTMLNWRVAVPAVAVLLMAVMALIVSRHHPAPSPSASTAVQVVLPSGSGGNLAPTLANYQMIASESLEKLEELLTRQGNQRLPPAPVYTASGLAFGKELF